VVIPTEERPQTAAQWRCAAEIVIGLTARAFDVPASKLVVKTRCRQPIAHARQAAIYLLHTVFGGTYEEAGRPFGRERTTVQYACSMIEDERDDLVFDRKLDLLEETLTRLWSLQRLRGENVSPAPEDRAPGEPLRGGARQGAMSAA
jgi:chromosomal replication initiation ATPase DnaA